MEPDEGLTPIVKEVEQADSDKGETELNQPFPNDLNIPVPTETTPADNPPDESGTTASSHLSEYKRLLLFLAVGTIIALIGLMVALIGSILLGLTIIILGGIMVAVGVLVQM